MTHRGFVGHIAINTSPYWLTGSPIQRTNLRPPLPTSTRGHRAMSRSSRWAVTMASDVLLGSDGASNGNVASSRKARASRRLPPLAGERNLDQAQQE
jgi:hypothetical protein